jgi:hypothetical protein
MFEINEQIVCINASMQAHTIEELSKDVPNWVKQDEKYTVRGFNDNNGIVCGILLEEIVNPVKFFKLINKFQEPAFAEWRFRKLAPSEVTQNVEQFETVI